MLCVEDDITEGQCILSPELLADDNEIDKDAVQNHDLLARAWF